MTAFDDWKAKAQQADIIAEAVARGAKLRRTGREHIGPCPACGGTDRFSVNPQKRIFNCRGAEGGDVIGLVMHIAGISFTQACEALTGEPPPNGPAKPLSDSEKAARASALGGAKAREKADRAKQMAYEEDTRESALRIWNASTAIDGTLAQTYLFQRGIPLFESTSLRFHPALPYPNKPKPYPALICRVDDMGGELCGIWRTFLRGDGRKADVDNAKLALGPVGGGAVRIGGIGPKIGLSEGLESGLGAWFLTGCKYPIWPTLSTSGLTGIELPLGVDHVCIFPDGDFSMRKKDGEFVPSVPAGRKAAVTLRARLLSEGVGCTIAAEPKAGSDYLDIWNEVSREVA